MKKTDASQCNEFIDSLPVLFMFISLYISLKILNINIFILFILRCFALTSNPLVKH